METHWRCWVTPRIEVVRLKAGATLPVYATSGSAGLDLYACLEGGLIIEPGQSVLIPTGVALAIPKGFVGLVRDRSSLARAGLHTVAGVIDSDYRGEVMVAAYNAGAAALPLRQGDRIAQMLALPCPRAEVVEVESLEDTERGAGGFGSTGR